MTAEITVGVATFAAVCALAARIRPARRRSPDRGPSTRPDRGPHIRPPRSRPARRIISTAALTLGIGLVAGMFAAAIVVVAALVRPRLLERSIRRRIHASIVSAFPDFVDLLVLTIRSGSTPVQAVRTLTDAAPAPIREAVEAVVRRIGTGERFADSIGELAIHLGPIAQPLSDALALADRHGTPLAPTLDRLADEGRAQRRRNAEVAARQLPIRLSFPLVGCTLPSFVLLTIVPLMAGTLSSLPGLRP